MIKQLRLGSKLYIKKVEEEQGGVWMQIGKKYTIHNKPMKEKYKARLIAEFRCFYLFDRGNYKDTVNKNSLKCKDVLISEH